MRKPRRQCTPAKADWFVNVIYGQTYCREHGLLCQLNSCQRSYGTKTDYSYGYYKGSRPGNRPVKSMIPPLHYELEREIKRCPNEGDTAECRYCGADIVFTHGWPHWVSENRGGECTDSDYGEHEPTDEYHEE